MVEPLVFAPTPTLLRAILDEPGITAHTLLTDAEALRDHAEQLAEAGKHDDAAAWRRFAAELEDSAERYPAIARIPPLVLSW